MLDCCHSARPRVLAGPWVMQRKKQDVGGKAHYKRGSECSWQEVLREDEPDQGKLEWWWHEVVLIQDCRWMQVHLQVTTLILLAFLPPQ